ncbi:MAG TPA: SDR family NAD(P)-dependent oxidoreductase [Acidimicrobiales bacterium]|nr:SDR family NAD(P)-dependent oxidoreductase [Acidimicrobiales bacterium]
MEQLAGKVAVVTGGASGIGRAVAHRLAREGMQLVLADIEEAPLQATERELADAGAAVTAKITDVTEPSSVEELRDHALARFGAVHLVHNNAGVGGGGGPMWMVPLADWHWTIGVNLFGVVHGIHTFVPLLVEQGEGHVVNTASIAGLISPAFMGPYNASKHAVVTISETLHKELATAGSPVGVSVLCPGFVRTNIAESGRNRPDWAPAAESGRAGAEVEGAVTRLVAGGIEPEQVADAVCEAVQTDTFYILTHADSEPAVALRMHDVLERRAPSNRPYR